MRFCISVPCLFKDMDFCEAIKSAASLGFDAVETWGWQGLDFKAVKNACETYGVEFLGMCTSEFNMTNPNMRQKWLDGLRESCKAAKEMGVKHLITQVGDDTGEPRDKQHESIVQALKEAVSILEESDVMIMLEPLNTYVDHKGYYLSSSAEAFEIIREVNHPLVKIVYDIYHQQIMEGNIIPSITNNLDCIAHLHCAGHPGRNELHLGENDYNVIFSAIDKAGYCGACGLEYNPTMDSVKSIELFKELYMK